ncbi:MAG: penicillin-binding protein [Actinobacteria bacterium]|nr:penicillin-binding protein [Actinomycetota bacterium]
MGMLLVLGACTHEPDPKDAAATLAAALSAGTMDTVAWTAGTASADDLTAQRTAAFTGLGDTPAPTVEVGAVERHESSATAELRWTWKLGAPANDWLYTTSATLTLVDGAWRAAWSPALLAPSLAAGETLSTTRLGATRGRVLGAADAVLVEPRPVLRVGIDKTLIDPAADDPAARALAGFLGLDADQYAAKVVGAGPKAFVEAIVLRAQDPGYDLGALAKLSGVRQVPDQLPLAPTRTFARAVLGTVGQATAEIIDASHGAIVAGDLTGLSGLQRQYDEQLRGRPGVEVIATAPDKVTRRQLLRTEAVAGEDLRTTLDPTLEQAAEGLLASQQSASAIVALRPSTGDVLAVASGPGGGGTSTATLGQYAPGSAFKVVSGLALLRTGLDPAATLSCPPSVTVDGKVFSNVPDYPAAELGDIPFGTAFAHSCNTAFVGAADRVDDAALASAAGSLGLTPDAPAGFAAYLGEVPATSSATSHAASMIGQGQVLASPLGMAVVAAGVQAGHTVNPRLVVAGAATESAASSTPTTAATATPPLTGPEARALATMMRAAVTDGTATILADVPGEPVGAKTGTAQYAAADGSTANHAWMIATQGDLAVAVFVETGDYGATTAGPIMNAFLRAAAAG